MILRQQIQAQVVARRVQGGSRLVEQPEETMAEVTIAPARSEDQATEVEGKDETNGEIKGEEANGETQPEAVVG